MPSMPLPDLAASLARRSSIADVRVRMERSSRELASGRRTDLHAASGGDPARLFAIESEQARVARDAQALSIASARATASQASLGKMQGLAETIGVELQASVARGDLPSARIQAEGAEEALRSVVQTLNGAFAGRALFAGAAVDGDALISADDLLAEVGGLLAAAADGDAAIAAVDAWFDDAGGGFETIAYLGDDADAPSVGFADGDAARLSVRADAPELRDLIKGLALAAAVVSPDYAGPPEGVAALLADAASAALASRDSLASLRADLGISERRIEEAAATASGRRNTLDLAWNNALQRDPYEAAAEFQALEQQLEMVYTITARLSRLQLNDFLR